MSTQISNQTGNGIDTSTTMSEFRFKDLFIRALEMTEAEFGTDMPVSSLILLLKIPTKGETSMSQVVKATKLSPAGASRTIATMAGYSKVNRRSIEKPYLVLTEDNADRRYKFVSFSDHGRAFINRILTIIN